MIQIEEHKNLVQLIKEVIYPWRKFNIAVDGITGVGKSGLSRYLSWQLDMPCVETDMFRIMNDVQPSYRLDDLKNVIESRHELNRPLILEGVFLLHTMEQLGIEPDFLIYVKNASANCGYALKDSLPGYLEKYDPEKKANNIFCTDEYLNM